LEKLETLSKTKKEQPVQCYLASESFQLHCMVKTNSKLIISHLFIYSDSIKTPLVITDLQKAMYKVPIEVFDYKKSSLQCVVVTTTIEEA
jgi:hypothetical protein